MAMAPTFLPSTATTPGPDQLRLAACPRCEGRRRILSEEPSGLVARCLGCGEVFDDPLATVREPHWAGGAPVVHLVGRGGQGVRRAV